MNAPLSEDFTIVRLFDSADRVLQIADAIENVGRGTVTICRAVVDENLPANEELAAVEAEAIFVGLSLNDVAEKVDSEPSFADTSFSVSIPEATRLLSEQAVVLRALGSATGGGDVDTDTDTEILATIPEQLAVQRHPDVGELDTRVRSALLRAEDTVRIAMPYFDPHHPTVETVQTLPKRGIETKILTRGIDPGTDRYRVLTEMRKTLSKPERRLVDVAELYHRDSSGKQAYATHAKLVVIDEKWCYAGSANFTVTNLTSNFEVGLLTNGPDVSLAAATFDAVFEASRSVGLPDTTP